MSMYLRPWISKHAWAKFNLGQLVQVRAHELRIPNQWGIAHIYKQWYAPTARHLTLYFHPPTSAQKTLFLPQKNCHPKSFFFTLSRILEIFHSKTTNRLEVEKRVPKWPLFLWLLSLKDPLFFALHTHVCLRGMLLPQTRSKAGKFCILETESCNLVNTFRRKFNKGDENKISVLQAQPTQLCIMNEFHWEGRDDIQAIIPLVNTEGDISYHPL